MSGSPGLGCDGRTTGRICCAEPRRPLSISRQAVCVRYRSYLVIRREHCPLPRRRYKGCTPPRRGHDGGLRIQRTPRSQGRGVLLEASFFRVAPTPFMIAGSASLPRQVQNGTTRLMTIGSIPSVCYCPTERKGHHDGQSSACQRSDFSAGA